MAKASTTRVPLPGERKKTAPQVGQRAKKAPPLSAEIIIDSDDESESQGTSNHGIGNASPAGKKADANPPNPSATPAHDQRGPPVPDTTSSESDDVSDNGTESDEASHSSSSSGSETQSGSEDEEEGSSGSKSDVEEPSQAASTIKPAASQLHTTHVRPAPAFEPPYGFQPISHLPSSSTAQKTFSTTDLANKQIWHITAPSDVPITFIQEVALDKVTNGEAILSHKGLDYCFIASAKSEQPSKLLIPTENGYKAVRNDIVETLHLQQIVRLPHLSSKQANPARGSDAAASYKTPAAKAPRQQPKGLKMRFRPSGFGSEDPGTIGSSEGEELDGSDQRQPQSKAPQSFEGSESSKKRKHEHVNGVNGHSSTPAKKSKTEKHKSKHSGVTNGDHHKSSTSASTSPHMNGGQQAILAGSPSMKKSRPDGDVHGHAEAHEEKAKRREEKRRRKREREKQMV